MRWKPQLFIQRSQTRAPSRVAPFLIARHEERTQVRDETNTCFFTRRGNKKKKKLYEKGVRSSDVQEKNENAADNIRFSVLQLRKLAQIFYSHWRKKKKLFSDGQGLPSKCIFSRYGTHACVRIPTASCHVCACFVKEGVFHRSKSLDIIITAPFWVNFFYFT